MLSAFAGIAQAAPPTQVTCGSIITAPGQYVLAGDCFGPGITIVASDVHLKLDGHTMSGLGGPRGRVRAFCVQRFACASEGPGTITRYRFGIFFEQGSDSHVEQVSATANTDQGLILISTTDTHVNNNAFSMNGDSGVDLSGNANNNHLNNNQTIGNSAWGIIVHVGSTGNHVNGNTALGNGFDLEDDNGNCDDNKWNGNTFNTSNQPSCIH